MGSQTGSQSVNVDNNRSAHSSSIGSTDFHVEQHQKQNTVVFAVLINKIDKIDSNPNRETILEQMDTKIDIWCSRAQETYNLANSIGRYFVSAKSSVGVSESFDLIANDMIAQYKVKRSHIHDKQMLEEIRGSMLSGYEAHGNCSDSYLGGPITENDNGNNPTIFNSRVNLTNPKQKSEAQKKSGCC